MLIRTYLQFKIRTKNTDYLIASKWGAKKKIILISPLLVLY